MTGPASPAPVILYMVVGLFLLIMVGVGVAAKRFVGDSDDFHRGGGRVPWWVAGTSMYMGSFSALAFVAFGSVVFTDGGVGLLMGYGTAMGFVVAGLFFAHRWHRARLLTPVEYLEKRFGAGTRQFVAVATIAMNAVNSALRLYAFAVMLNGLMGVPIMPAILISGAAMATVAVAGGFWGIVLADAVQFVMLIAGLVPLLIMSILRLGGWEAFYEFATTDMLRFHAGGRGWDWLMTWWIFLIIATNFSLPAIQRFSSVPTEKDARKAAFLTAALLIPTPFLALVPVTICLKLFPATPPELAFATIAKDVLPIGLLGLMVGAMIAATVSEMETAFNIDSGIVTRDIYQRRIHPDASTARLLWIGRVATLASAAVAIGLALALAMTRAGIFNLSEGVGSRVTLALCIPFVVGILTARFSQRAFFFSVAVSLAASLILWALGWSSAEVRLPLMGAGLIALVAGAFAFPPLASERKRVETFFAEIAKPHPQKAEVGAAPLRSQTTRLVAVTISLMGLVPFVLPFVAGTEGAARLVEYGTGAVLFVIAGALFALQWLARPVART